jgi:hypothetical protein
VEITPLVDCLAGDAHELSDFTIGLAQNQKIDGMLLLGGIAVCKPVALRFCEIL